MFPSSLGILRVWFRGEQGDCVDIYRVLPTLEGSMGESVTAPGNFEGQVCNGGNQPLRSQSHLWVTSCDSSEALASFITAFQSLHILKKTCGQHTSVIKSEQHSGPKIITGNNTINSPECLHTEIAKEDEQLQELHNCRYNGIITARKSHGIPAPNTLLLFSMTRRLHSAPCWHHCS